jgi:predicted nucleotidyltransferase
MKTGKQYIDETIIQTRLNEAKAVLVEYAQRNPSILRVWLFGSYIHGTPDVESDLDVLMELDPSTRPERWSRATWHIEHERLQVEIQPLISCELHQAHFYTRWFDPEMKQNALNGRMIYESQNCATSVQESFL